MLSSAISVEDLCRLSLGTSERPAAKSHRVILLLLESLAVIHPTLLPHQVGVYELRPGWASLALGRRNTVDGCL